MRAFVQLTDTQDGDTRAQHLMLMGYKDVLYWLEYEIKNRNRKMYVQ